MDTLNRDITPQVDPHEFEGLQGHQGGSLNTVGTERYCKVQNMRFTMWISKVEPPRRLPLTLALDPILTLTLSP